MARQPGKPAVSWDASSIALLASEGKLYSALLQPWDQRKWHGASGLGEVQVEYEEKVLK